MQRASCRDANGRGCIGIGKGHALPYQAVEIWSLYMRISVRRDRIKAELIGEEKSGENGTEDGKKDILTELLKQFEPLVGDVSLEQVMDLVNGGMSATQNSDKQ
jgi:hypothetical protein